jgi:antitoxin HicB
MSTKNLAYYMALKYPVELEEAEDGGYFATNPDLDGCMAEGGTPSEVIANLANSRELWIETRLANGYSVPEPRVAQRSGVVSLRMAPSLHAQLANLADRKGISLNLLINSVLARHAGGEDSLREAVAKACVLLAKTVEQAIERNSQRGNYAPFGMPNVNARFMLTDQSLPVVQSKMVEA